MQVKAIIKITMVITHVVLIIIISSCEVCNFCCFTFLGSSHCIFLPLLFIWIFGFFKHPIYLFKSPSVSNQRAQKPTENAKL